jgi:hypothetical protein
MDTRVGATSLTFCTHRVVAESSFVLRLPYVQAWSGEGLSQIDFMQKDECILVDMNDNVIGMHLIWKS